MLTSLIIATRQSPLALWQAEHVQSRLKALYPTMDIQLLPMTTEGDRRLEVALANLGGKGLFIKELEHAMLEGKAHIAIHSLKDVPMQLPEEFSLGAILEREDPRDVFVSHHYKQASELPHGAKVGTSSPRRATQLRYRYPHINIELLRGNVGTRLKKLELGEYDAILLAAAGLKRLNLLDERFCTILEVEESLPAVGQGTLAIECLANRHDLIDVLRPLHDESAALCAQAERAFSQCLAGNCHMPIAAHATLHGEGSSNQYQRLKIQGCVGHPDRLELWKGELDAPLGAFDSFTDASELGWLLGRRCQLETPWLEEVIPHQPAKSAS
ncbi:MAG: hydroxymethylbilane synthase [Pseudomonadota bacterium]